MLCRLFYYLFLYKIIHLQTINVHFLSKIRCLIIFFYKKICRENWGKNQGGLLAGCYFVLTYKIIFLRRHWHAHSE